MNLRVWKRENATKFDVFMSFWLSSTHYSAFISRKFIVLFLLIFQKCYRKTWVNFHQHFLKLIYIYLQCLFSCYFSMFCILNINVPMLFTISFHLKFSYPDFVYNLHSFGVTLSLEHYLSLSLSHLLSFHFSNT